MTPLPSIAAPLRRFRFICAQCGATADATGSRFRCDCGAPFELDLSAVESDLTAELREHFDARRSALRGPDRSGVWRYRELVLPLTDKEIVSREEGNTPLYAAGAAESTGWRRVGAFAGVERLFLKHEGQNPTGSFKDRGMTVGMSIARALGSRAVACASTGNTSASLAAYAAQAALPALVFLPAGKVATGKLAQSVAYGARRVEVAGDFDDAMRQVEAVASDLGIYLLNSINPYRLAGQRSIAYELLHQLDWHPPDWLVLPAGNLGNTSAIGAALLRARDLGLIARVPRLAAVQAAAADPFYRAYASEWRTFASLRASTLATAINIGAPVSYLRARAVIEATNGVVTEVTDDEIFAAKAQIDRAGIGCEPASAASIAGVRRLVREGVIAPDASVAAILTGHILKDPEQATGDVAADEPDPAVDELLRDVHAALAKRS